MADEIYVSLQVSATKGSLTESKAKDKYITMTGGNYAAGAQTIGTTHEAINLGDVTTPGISFFVNLDATNYVEIGKDSSGTFVPMLKLMPGEPQLWRPAVTALYAKANAAPVVLQYLVLQD